LPDFGPEEMEEEWDPKKWDAKMQTVFTALDGDGDGDGDADADADAEPLHYGDNEDEEDGNDGGNGGSQVGSLDLQRCTLDCSRNSTNENLFAVWQAQKADVG
jgi:hypothetical protein